MFSIAGYVPLSDLAHLCDEAAHAAPNEQATRDLFIFSGWSELSEKKQTKACRGLGYLLVDIIIKTSRDFLLCSPDGGKTVVPGMRLLALKSHWSATLLNLEVNKLLDYATSGHWRYDFLDTQTWCIKRRPMDEQNYDGSDGEVTHDPEDAIAYPFLGWALTIKRENADTAVTDVLNDLVRKNAPAALANVMVAATPSGRGRPGKQIDAITIYTRLFPNGHGGVPMKAVLKAIREGGIEVSAATLRRAIQNRDRSKDDR